MAIIKCKMCGGDIELSPDRTFGSCDSCGSTMTFPKVDDEQRAAAFNRGNHFRRTGDFDKALAVYERIVRENEEDAEAHWCCALCRFGIEYVEDPATYEWIPTCHRASFDSFLDDVDYLAAVEHSDGVTRRQYQKDGAKIAEVQRGILATSQNEKPFDVFICYKESDENGQRTRDSLLAQDIYYQLTEQGRRVFFARITLEDKVGAQYEPYIFAALNSAKVMVVVGTRPEHLNAVWVKNEWSRFLALMKKDRSKLILPCYRDMDPYDMPEQLTVLQSYDMGKIGFIQDLIRGIAKVLDTEAKPAARETVVVHSEGGGNAAALLKRGMMALEDGEWAKADEFFEQVLNNDPECAGAYLGKVYAKECVGDKAALVEKRMKRLEQDVKLQRHEIAVVEEMVGEAVAKYTLPGYLEEAELRSCYAESLSYESAAEYWMQQEEAEQDYWSHVSQMARAVRFGSEEARSVVEELLAAIRAKISEATLTVETARVQAIEDARGQGDRLAEEKYRAAFSRKTAYEKDLKERQEARQRLAIRRRWIAPAQNLIAAHKYSTVGLKSNGTMVSNGRNHAGQGNVESLCDVVAVSQGERHTVVLKANGNVEAVGGNEFGQCNTVRWREITAVAAGGLHTVGLKANGTVLAVGNNIGNRCDVSEWKDIAAIAAGYTHTVGLKTDGTVVAVGNNRDGQCEVAEWSDIVAVAVGDWHTVGLKADGTVVAAGYGERNQCQVEDWRDIVAIAAGEVHTVGLKADGTVVAAGRDADGQCDVGDWRGIVAVTAGSRHTVGLKADGTVVAAGSNDVGQCDVAGWKLFDRMDMIGQDRGAHTAALKAEKRALEEEYANLKGVFSGKRRKEIEARLEELKSV